MPGISCTRWLCWISLILFGSSQMKSWKPQRMVVCTIFWQWIQYFPVPHGKELSQPICPSPLWVQVLIELSSSSPYRTNSISSASSRAQRARSDSAVNSVSWADSCSMLPFPAGLSPTSGLLEDDNITQNNKGKSFRKAEEIFTELVPVHLKSTAS